MKLYWQWSQWKYVYLQSWVLNGPVWHLAYSFSDPCILQIQHNIAVNTILISATDLRVAVRSAVFFYAVTLIFEAYFLLEVQKWMHLLQRETGLQAVRRESCKYKVIILLVESLFHFSYSIPEEILSAEILCPYSYAIGINFSAYTST